MNKSLAFFGREREIDQLRGLHMLWKHVLIVGSAGIGKTALLRQVGRYCPLLICEETSSLRRICDGLERQLGWVHHKLNVIERKNRLLAYLEHRDERIVFDHVARPAPRVSRFMAHLIEHIPTWIVCHSDQPNDLGHLWQHVYDFTRVEIVPLRAAETRVLIQATVSEGNVQPDARQHADELHRMSGGNPRILKQLLTELAIREYKIDNPFDLHFLDLDRRIHEIDAAVKAATSKHKR
jgi:hypothetical protein